MNICFIGGGNMASALIGGLLGKGFPAATDRRGGNQCRQPRAAASVISRCMCMKALSKGWPAARSSCSRSSRSSLAQWRGSLPHLLTGQLLISIAAGILATDLAALVKQPVYVVRAMPNTPALIQQRHDRSCTALPAVSAAQREQAQRYIWRRWVIPCGCEDEAMTGCGNGDIRQRPGLFVLFHRGAASKPARNSASAEDARS